MDNIQKMCDIMGSADECPQGREKKEKQVNAYSERMKAARKAKGLSHEAAAARASRLLLPSQEFTSSTSRRTEQGPEEDADPVRVWALAQVYGVPLEELSPIAAAWFGGVGGAGLKIVSRPSPSAVNRAA